MKKTHLYLRKKFFVYYQVIFTIARNATIHHNKGRIGPESLTWTNLIALGPMVFDKKQIFLTKFLGEPLRIILVKKIENPTSRFWREDFLRFWPYMGMAASWVMWPNFFLTIFFSRDVRMLHMKSGWNWLNGLGGKYDLLRYAKKWT